MERVTRADAVVIISEIRLGVDSFILWCDRMCHRYHRCRLLGLLLEDGNQGAVVRCESEIRCGLELAYWMGILDVSHRELFRSILRKYVFRPLSDDEWDAWGYRLCPEYGKWKNFYKSGSGLFLGIGWSRKRGLYMTNGARSFSGIELGGVF